MFIVKLKKKKIDDYQATVYEFNKKYECNFYIKITKILEFYYLYMG